VLAVGTVWGINGCAGSADVAGTTAVRPAGGSARGTLSASVSILADGEALLRLRVEGVRTAGAPLPLGARDVPLGTGTGEPVAVPVELGPCLADPQRAGANGAPSRPDECVVALTLSLLLDGLVVDSVRMAPLVMQAGRAVSAGAVTLREVADIQVRDPDGRLLGAGTALVVPLGERRRPVAEVLDGTGRVRATRSVSWSVTPPGVARLEDGGTVLGTSPGMGVLGVSSGGVDRTVPLRVLRAPASLRVAARAGSGGRVTVTSQPAGIACTLDDGVASGSCDRDFPGDTTVVLQAFPEGLTRLDGWGGACAGTGSCTLDMSAPRVAEVASTARVPLAVRGGGAGSGTVSGADGAITCAITNGLAGGAGCETVVDRGTTVALSATALAEHDFTGWSGGCTGNGACTVAMTQPREVIAGFAPRQLLTITGDGTGTGTITSAPAGISCRIVGGAAASSGCSARFPLGTTVVLSAVADAGHDFFDWSGSCTGTTALAGCTVDMTQPRAVQARLHQRQRLVVQGEGTGDGAVSAPAAGVTCPIAGGVAAATGCDALLRYGTSVTLTAAPAAAADFDGWTGACTGTTPCTVTMTQPRTVRGRFTAWPALTVRLDGSGSATVRSQPAGISCTRTDGTTSGTCAARFPLGTAVALTVTTDQGTVFLGWGDACQGTGGCNVTLSAGRTVSAAFLGSGSLTVADDNSDGSGSVDGTPGSLSCTITPTGLGGTCSEGYPNGTVITLRATPLSAPFTFSGWTGAGCSGTDPCSVTIGGAMTVQARFQRLFMLEIETDPQAVGNGRVTSAPAGIGCDMSQGGTSPNPACAASFASGTVVTLTAAADANSDFLGWGGACAQAPGAQCTVTMSAARSVIASFVPRMAPVVATPERPAPSPR
jgi:hypothetical protein